MASRSFVGTLFFLNVLLSATRRHVTMTSQSCFNFKDVTDLQGCSFIDRDLVNCLVLVKDERTDMRTSLDVYFNVTFRALNVETHGTSPHPNERLCVGLSQINVHLRRKPSQQTASRVILPDNTLRYINIMKPKSIMDVSFIKEEQVPVGWIEVKHDSRQMRSTDCVVGVSYNSSLLNWVRYPDLFESAHKLFMDSLGAQIVRLHLEFDPEVVSKVELQKLGNYLKEQKRIESVKIIHGSWTHLNDSSSWSMPFLVDLDLSWDRIKHINSDWFQNITNVVYLSLAHNKLETVPEGITNLKKLKYLDLSYNPIKYTTSTLLNVLREHQGLNLSLSSTPVNKLKVLEGILKTINIISLDISFCNISIDSEDGTIFRHQYQMEKLNLSYNSLKTIPRTLVEDLHSLRALDLSHNNLSESLRLQLGKSPIDVMDLSWNDITDPSEILLNGSVIALHLSNNKIHTWLGSNIFFTVNKSDTWVKFINISQNKIQYFNKEMIEALSTLESVDLGGNMLDCSDCRTPGLQEWLSSKEKPMIWNLGCDVDLICYKPEGFHRHRYTVAEFQFLDDVCEGKLEDNALVVVGIILASLTAIILFLMLLVYICYQKRYDISYAVYLTILRQLWKIPKRNPKDLKYDAFISYSPEDRDWVIQYVLTAVENGPNKFRACIRDRDLALGALIVDGTIDLIHSSRNTIIILSHSYLENKWCRWEMEHLKIARHSLILLEKEPLDRQSLPREIRYLMDTRTYLPWQEDHDGDCWSRVAQALAENKTAVPETKRFKFWRR